MGVPVLDRDPDVAVGHLARNFANLFRGYHLDLGQRRLRRIDLAAVFEGAYLVLQARHPAVGPIAPGEARLCRVEDEPLLLKISRLQTIESRS